MAQVCRIHLQAMFMLLKPKQLHDVASLDQNRQLYLFLQRGDKILPADLMQSIKAPPTDGSFVPAQAGAIAQVPAARPVPQAVRPSGQASSIHTQHCNVATVMPRVMVSSLAVYVIYLSIKPTALR